MQLKVVPANDVFGALNLMTEVAEGKLAGFISQAEVNGVAPVVEDLPKEVDSNTALIVESSGSLGVPKRIALSLEALRYSAEASANRLGGHGQWLLALPVNFIAGANVLFRSVIADTQPVLMNTQLPFTVEAFVRGAALMGEGRKYTSLVPLQLAKLAQASKENAFVFSMLRKFDAILVGGQMPNMTDVLELRARGINVVISYGMTETCGGCVYDGLPLDGVSVTTNAGLIEIAGPVLANGLGEKFVTSDLGEIVEGRLEVLGRADRVIISGGLKLSLDHFERRALELAGVDELIAVSVSTEFGESLAVVYVGSPEVSFIDLAQSISPAARPRVVVRVESLPRLVSGKPDLVAARRLAEASL